MPLPNFLIIGASKAGTTSFYHYLAQHPGIFMSPIKEVNYFCYEGQDEPRFRARSLEEYMKLFQGVNGQTAIGEASPLYLYSDNAPARIHKLLPAVRLIISLRNPAERAYSSYVSAVRRGAESRPAAQAIVPGTVYVERGFYAARLRRYFGFFDRSQIKILLYEDFAEDVQETLKEIYRFVGVDRGFLADVTIRHNRASHPKSVWLNNGFCWLNRQGWLPYVFPPRIRYWGRCLREWNMKDPEPFASGLRGQLLHFYRQDIQQTGRLIGRDLSCWLA